MPEQSPPAQASRDSTPRQPLVDAASARRSGTARRLLRRVVVGAALGVLALVLGLLAAYAVSLVRGRAEPSAPPGQPSPASPAPPAPSGSTGAAATSAPPPAASVPADWASAPVSALGLVVRHPAAWVRHSQRPVTVWVRPTQAGGRGVDEVGVGRLAPAPPAQALESFARSFFARQTVLLLGPATGDAQQADLTLTYRRTDEPVRVALHGERTAAGVLMTLARAPATPEKGATELLAQFRAGVRPAA